MRFISYVLKCPDIILFNILKCHLHCKLFQKTKLFIMKHTICEKKSENYAKFQGNPGKVAILSSKIFDHPVTKSFFFFIFARLPSSNYIDQVQKVWSVVEVDAFSEGAIKLLPKLQLKFSKELIYDLVPVKPSNTMNVVMK